MEISETIQTNMCLCTRNSRESICKPEHRVIVNSSNKICIIIFQSNESVNLLRLVHTQRVSSPILIPNYLKNAKNAFPTVKNIVFDSKIIIFAIDNNIFAEHDHRLKIENVVVSR